MSCDEMGRNWAVGDTVLCAERSVKLSDGRYRVVF